MCRGVQKQIPCTCFLCLVLLKLSTRSPCLTYTIFTTVTEIYSQNLLQKFKQFQDVFSHHPCLVFRVAGRQTASIVMRCYFDKLLLPEEADLNQLVSVSTIT